MAVTSTLYDTGSGGFDISMDFSTSVPSTLTSAEGYAYFHRDGWVRNTSNWSVLVNPGTDVDSLYFAGDTGLTYDMKLIGENGIDLAILPIGDNYTMGPDDALRAVRLLQPRMVVPFHYDTFPVIQQDPKAFLARVTAETGIVGRVLKPGESLTLA